MASSRLLSGTGSAILYLDKNGCAWRDLPHDFPNHNTVYVYFTLWRDDGTPERIYETLHGRWRRSVRRDENPSAGALDSQSVQAAHEAAERGDDRNKRIVGRKRHLCVDTEGLPLAIAVTPASANDNAAAYGLIEAAALRSPRLAKLWWVLKYDRRSLPYTHRRVEAPALRSYDADAFRGIGLANQKQGPGLAASALAAVDAALWELKARLLDQPLVVALDAVRTRRRKRRLHVVTDAELQASLPPGARRGSECSR